MSSTPPEVSIIIPTYNRAKYLQDLMVSITRQTFTNYEVVIVDDGSTDNTQAILSQWRSRNGDNRIQKLKFGTNRGEQAARRAGFEASRGEFLIFLDDDVVLLHSYVEKLLNAIKQSKKYGFSYCDRYIKRVGSVQELAYERKDSGAYSYERLVKGNFISFCSMVRRDAIKPFYPGIFNTEIKRLQDWYFWRTLGAAGWQGAYIHEILFLMYITPIGITARGEMDWKNAVEKIRAIFRDNIPKVAALKKG